MLKRARHSKLQQNVIIKKKPNYFLITIWQSIFNSFTSICKQASGNNGRIKYHDATSHSKYELMGEFIKQCDLINRDLIDYKKTLRRIKHQFDILIINPRRKKTIQVL